MRFTHLSPKNRRGALRTRIGRHGLAAMLSLVLLPAMVGAGTFICGYPASGRVVISRAQQPLAEFTVTHAESSEQRRQGLMHCAQLEPGTGMLFLYDESRPRTFWMKDTPLELGIIFIAGDGQIMAIERGVPGSRERIQSPGPVRYVLEINHKEARGLRVGDRMRRIVPAAPRSTPGRKGRP
jgi:uncharacterized membrane protein (UPF0127 family)